MRVNYESLRKSSFVIDVGKKGRPEDHASVDHYNVVLHRDE